MTKYPTKPTLRLKKALSDLLQHNEQTQGRIPGEMFLGKDIFIVRLREPRVISGQWEDIERTVDIFDLMDAHQQEQQKAPKKLTVKKESNHT